MNATEPDICTQSTKMVRELIVPIKRRALTLRFLATGESFRSLHFRFTISRPAISYIVTEVCEAVPKKLGPSYLKVPSSEQERLQITKQFEEKWQFPNYLGAIDGNILPSNLLQTRDLIREFKIYDATTATTPQILHI